MKWVTRRKGKRPQITRGHHVRFMATQCQNKRAKIRGQWNGGEDEMGQRQRLPFNHLRMRSKTIDQFIETKNRGIIACQLESGIRGWQSFFNMWLRRRVEESVLDVLFVCV